jgi:hypothetical protein
LKAANIEPTLITKVIDAIKNSPEEISNILKTNGILVFDNNSLRYEIAGERGQTMRIEALKKLPLALQENKIPTDISQQILQKVNSPRPDEK